MLKVETLQVMSLMAHATAVNNYIRKPCRVKWRKDSGDGAKGKRVEGSRAK
jgi:hypothetical protein